MTFISLVPRHLRDTFVYKIHDRETEVKRSLQQNGRWCNARGSRQILETPSVAGASCNDVDSAGGTECREFRKNSISCRAIPARTSDERNPRAQSLRLQRNSRIYGREYARQRGELFTRREKELPPLPSTSRQRINQFRLRGTVD